MEYAIGWIVGGIVYCIVFGCITNYVANSKGYDHGFAWGFWLGIIGLLVVGFKPNVQQSAQTQQRPMHVENTPKPKPQWICTCGAKNPDTLNYCLSCRRDRGGIKPIVKISCPHCGATNNQLNKVCFACSKPLHEEAATNSSEVVTSLSAADEILKFKQLQDSGVITREEFEAKKKQLLGL